MNAVTTLLAKRMGYLSEEPAAEPAGLLAGILDYAYANVPYYQETFRQAGVIRNGRVDLERFTEIPFLDKPALRAHSEDLISRSIDRRTTYWNTSGGSTGEPTRFLQDKAYLRQARATTYRIKAMAGYAFGEPMVKLWGDERELLEGTRSFRSRMANRIKGITLLNSFCMTPENMREYVQTINRVRPKLIVAYAQALYELCRFAEAKALPIRGVGAVMTSAGTLYPFMRETIQRVCGAQVFNRYGGREVGNIAGECDRQEGLHIMAHSVHVEVVDPQGRPCQPGVEGEIIVTSLINRAMPLIRYRIGDRGILSDRPCSCGRPGPMFQQVTGRMMDVFRTREGKIIPAEYFIHMIGVVLNKGAIRKFQLVQKDYDLVRLQIVKSGEIAADSLEDIAGKIRLVMGKDCRVETELVADIPPLPSGKYRYTLSEIEV
ncbi:MAG TPA: hypothetical protein VFA07_12620 [Chthonomonadaceae bacterium]|nr:hypothetical protein [Chthonomonadaceae bacterium]